MLIGFSLAAILTISLLLIRLVTRSSELEAALARARETGEVEPVAEAIHSEATDRRPTAWNQAIDDLWQSYHREEAARLVVIAAERSDASILQYWMREIIEVEPEIAERVFSQTFLDRHFDPDVASRCGPSGCGCG